MAGYYACGAFITVLSSSLNFRTCTWLVVGGVWFCELRVKFMYTLFKSVWGLVSTEDSCMLLSSRVQWVFSTEKFEFLECRRSRLSQFDNMFRLVLCFISFLLTILFCNSLKFSNYSLYFKLLSYQYFSNLYKIMAIILLSINPIQTPDPRICFLEILIICSLFPKLSLFHVPRPGSRGGQKGRMPPYPPPPPLEATASHTLPPVFFDITLLCISYPDTCDFQKTGSS